MTPERAREIYQKQRRSTIAATRGAAKGRATNHARSTARFERLIELIRAGKTKSEAVEELGVTAGCVEQLCKRHFGSYHYPTPEELDDVV